MTFFVPPSKNYRWAPPSVPWGRGTPMPPSHFFMKHRRSKYWPNVEEARHLRERQRDK